MLDRMLLAAGGEEKLYVEDVFSTYLYTGNGSTQTITNGIDLAGKGGLVWIKSRSNIVDNFLFDTTRGVNVEINSNKTDANATLADSVTAFNSNGFTIGNVFGIGANTSTFASWTFREAPKFFDVVTYTGNGANRTIAHNLGVAPGCILVKRTDTTADWQVYHRSNANTEYMVLNSTAAKATGTTRWNSTTPTASEFTVGTDATVNASGGTYVAYLFAHDATADGIIQCGSYTGNGAADGPTVTLGWEPQWVMVKNASSTSVWIMVDNMRGMTASGDCGRLDANQSASEGATTGYPLAPNATGFQVKGATAFNGNGQTSVYIAIRRGPMKTPTVGTSVFAPALQAANSTAQNKDYGIVTDAVISKARNSSNVYTGEWWDRLRGATLANTINSTDFEKIYASSLIGFDYQTGVRIGTDTSERIQQSCNWVHYAFRRAPSFFDEVCYTGTGANLTLNHSLGVVPELMLVKRRDTTGAWQVYSANLANTEYLVLNTTAAKATGTTRWNSTTPTSTVFTVGTDATVNASGGTYVAYLFATCPGVSKVGTYTGNGSSQTINCGFSSGARFFLVKRTDSTGDWWVYDSARGIVAAADPALRLNSTAAEDTSADAVDTDSTGIIVNQEATCNINVNGATYIYLAIA